MPALVRRKPAPIGTWPSVRGASGHEYHHAARSAGVPSLLRFLGWRSLCGGRHRTLSLPTSMLGGTCQRCRKERCDRPADHEESCWCGCDRPTPPPTPPSDSRMPPSSPHVQRERPQDRVMKEWRALDQWASLVSKYWRAVWASQALDLLPHHDDFFIGANYMARLPDAGCTRDVDGEQACWQSGPRKAQTC